MKSILIVRLGAMGDIVHSLPGAASLKHSFPGARITWIVEPAWVPLLEGNGFVDREFPLLDRIRRVTVETVKKPVSNERRGWAAVFAHTAAGAILSRPGSLGTF